METVMTKTLPDTFEDVFDGLAFEALSILYDRQRAYGPENIRRQGLWGMFTRIKDDKIARVQTAFNGSIERGVISLNDIEDSDDDTFEDALFDIANYALIMIAVKRGQWGHPLREDTHEIETLAEAHPDGVPQLTLTPEEQAWVARSAFAGEDEEPFSLAPLDDPLDTFLAPSLPEREEAVKRLEAERQARGLSGKD